MAEKDKDSRKRVRAAALKYRRDRDDSPQVVASGAGKVAERIIEIAREQGIHIEKDPDLVEILSSIDVGEHIDPDLFVVVAELLVFVYRLKERWREEHA